MHIYTHIAWRWCIDRKLNTMVDSDEIDYELASKPHLQIHSCVYACTIIYKYFNTYTVVKRSFIVSLTL